MTDDATEPVIAPRTVWMSVLEVANHTDMSLADKIGSMSIRIPDFETQGFLALRLKLIRGVYSGFEQETAEKLAEGNAKEAEIEIELTAAEAIYLDLSIGATAFQGAMPLKKGLWRILVTLNERKAQ